MIGRLILAGCLAGLASGALAQASQPKPITRSAFDANTDTAFNNIDTNHDGILSASEVQAAEAKAVQQVEATVRARLQAQFKALDTNKDGQLSLAEFSAIAPGVKTNDTPAQIIEKLDTNHDGKVTADEFKAPRIAAFNKADTNHDGVLSVQEQAAAAQKK